VAAEIEEEGEGPGGLAELVDEHLVFFLLGAVGAEALLEGGLEVEAQGVSAVEVVEQEAVEAEGGGVVVEREGAEEGVEVGGPVLVILIEEAEEGEAGAGLGDDGAIEDVELELVDGEVAEVVDGAGGGGGEGGGGVGGEFHGGKGGEFFDRINRINKMICERENGKDFPGGINRMNRMEPKTKRRAKIGPEQA